MKQKYATIAGYGIDTPTAHLAMAQDAVRILTVAGFGICNGGYQGIFEASFKAAIEFGGHTRLIIDHQPPVYVADWVDEMETVETQDKHSVIAQRSSLVVVIGGGAGSKKLVDRFIQLAKPVFAMAGTGGATELLKEFIIDPIDLKKRLQTL